MNERVHQALDGELERAALTPAEAAELAAVERAMAHAIGSIPAAPIPDEFALQTLDRIEAIAAAAAPDQASRPNRVSRGVLGWLWAPRPISWRFRPAYALAAVVLLAVALVPQWRATGGSAGMAQPPSQVLVLVQFRLDAPTAGEVRLAGDFSDWQPVHLMSRTEAGVWQVFVPLTPGVHEYAYVIDGDSWQTDPLAPAVDDGFGGVNSRVAVLTAGERKL